MSKPVTIEDIYQLFRASAEEFDRRLRESDRRAAEADAGTGVTVRRLVSWYKLGLTPEEILNRIGHPNLDLAKIYAALTYYHANREEIEADLAQEEADVKQFEQEWLQSKLN
jgi:hypothetical protein